MNKTISKKELLQNDQTIELRSELLTSMPLLLVGTAPCIVHAWSEKARTQMRDKQTKQARSARIAKDPVAEYEASKYRSVEGWEGVPAHGLKGALVEGARFIGGSRDLNMTTLKSALRVVPDCPVSNLLRIYSPNPARMREDLVRIGSGISKTTDLRYRAEYWPWYLRIVVCFPTAMFSPQQIADLIRAAGAFNGFCEWRPGSPVSRTGSFGTFEIGDAAAIRDFARAFGIAVEVAA